MRPCARGTPAGPSPSRSDRWPAEVLIGIDLGQTACKLVALHPTRGVIATAQRGYPTAQPRPGWAEQEPEDWVRAAAGACSEVVRAAGAPILGVALTGATHNAVLLDSEGDPVRPCIALRDGRASRGTGALSLADCAQAARAAALAVHELRIIGGGARSRLWSQIVADALGRPLLVPALSDASSGAALLELYRDARESLGPLTRRLTQLTTTAEPDAAKDW